MSERVREKRSEGGTEKWDLGGEWEGGMER